MVAEGATFTRALVAFLALPVMVAGVVPVWLIAATVGWSGRADTPLKMVGGVIVAIGLTILLWCVRDFFVSGRGTLAPWDPPRTLVTVGLYRLVRNPMYLGVVTIVSGVALCFASQPVGWYAALLLVAFHARVVLFEEPWLARTFPDAWPRYASAVRRWWPRLTPWE
jgi:protein-S-isoprenylcysteine O-methyltransferase Ste14